MDKAAQFRSLLLSPTLEFACEAHNGLSARIAEEAGFRALWASSLTISAAMGVRDNNEASWTQILETLEFMSDATSIPILVDADTGYGNFNNVRRLVKKLEQRSIAAVCIEDKIFPKTNSLLAGAHHDLADIDEFCGKIKAAKDTQTNPNFSVVARIEALIAGAGMAEALKRADAYHRAGADAILIHSKSARPDEVLEFKKEWGNRSPVIIVPTTYYTTSVEVFENAGFSLVIWANMILRGATRAMQETAAHLASMKSLVDLDERIVSVKEIFRLQGSDELAKAEDRYLPQKGSDTHAVILAASQGKELGVLTAEKPKALLEVAGKPILYRQMETLNSAGIKDITVVRGFKKELINKTGITYVDNDEYASTQEVYSLGRGLGEVIGTTLIAYGDMLYKKYILDMLLEAEDDFVIVVDSDWKLRSVDGRYADFVCASAPHQKRFFDQKTFLRDMGPTLATESITGEWIGLCKVSSRGLAILKQILNELSQNPAFKKMRGSELFRELVSRGHDVRVVYVTGHWLDVDDIKDFTAAGSF